MSSTATSVAGAGLAEILSLAPAAGSHDDPIVAGLYETPVGPMLGAAISDGLCLLEFVDRRALRTELTELVGILKRPVVHADGVAPGCGCLSQMGGELAAYFRGELREFTTKLHAPGTPFERAVWQQLLLIPFGGTCSYGDVAERLGKPGASRAVGRANGHNRIAIVIPCHRVIEANGNLRGYGGGLERKRFLLDNERRFAGDTGSLFS